MVLWVEPELNQEMVCPVLTERQTSYGDVKCRITFLFHWKFHVHVYGPQFRWKLNQYNDFVKVIQDSTAYFHLLKFNIHFI